MTVEDLIIYGKKFVHSHHAKMILADLLKMNPLELLNHLDEVINDEISEEYKIKIESLKQNKPVQYVIGNVNFYGNTFLVNENVLIPRFETEELIEHTSNLIKEIFENKNIKIIDLGTGTGCIGLTLKNNFHNSEVTLVDISKKALEVAKKNMENLGLQVNLLESDFFDKVTEKYDVVISNPPYIKTNEPIEEIVFNNEPHLALYAGEDGLDCYRKILNNITSHINPTYLIAFEIGETQSEDIIKLIKNNLPNANIIPKKDMQGRDRMLFIYEKK
ncbi:MAG: peptide chain release factor N(5)-glutamine methyltransferase [Firmicutes bacterium]|nr:peptide chain release factor N(5)-glutamine methyltransferase [Bacillota bacterium]